MTFLAPFALLGVLLLILPIVVHLFKPRKMKQTPFSSLRWLKQTHQRLSRRIQWHQWLLFLLRAGCILLLVVALARPLIGFWGAKSVDRFVIVDTSRSMAYRAGETQSSLERATELAGRLVQNARVGDRTSVIVASSSPRLLSAPGDDASAALPALNALEPGLADVRLSASLPLVRALVPSRKDREVEIVFVTDNLQFRWQQSDLHQFMNGLPNTITAKVVDVGPGDAYNGWIGDARLLQIDEDGDRVIRVLVGCNRDSTVTRQVRLTGVPGFDASPQPVTLKPGSPARVEFRIPARVSLQGQVAELRLEPTDALASDDTFFLNLDASLALRVLLIEPETLGADGRTVGLALKTALESLSAAKLQTLEITTRNTTAVTAKDIANADVVLLAGVPDLPDGPVDSLEKRVRAGAGLAIFLGPTLKPGFFNEKLHRTQQPAEGLAPLAVKTPESLVQGKPGALTSVRWSHPVLAPLQDPVLSDFTHTRFQGYANLTGAVHRPDAVLARFDDDVPAIVERSLGAGRVLLFNLSANDEWTDLPRRKSFVPFLDQTLAHLSTGAGRQSFTVGRPMTLAVPGAEKETRVVAPSGAKVTPRLLVQRGTPLVHLEEVVEAGAYRIEKAGKIESGFVVNADRADSSLTPMDAKALAEWWTPASIEVVSGEAFGQELAQQGSHWPLWPALVLLAGLLLIAETIYVHWLCPRANPKAVAAVVPQRGMLKPLEEKAV